MAVGASRYETGQQVLYTSNRPGEGSVLVIVYSVSTNVALGEEPMIAVRMVRNDDYTRANSALSLSVPVLPFLSLCSLAHSLLLLALICIIIHL